MTPQRPARLVRFGVFEMDVDAGDLCNGGRRIRLQEQPRQVLLMLLARPGEIVTRDALRAALWPHDTFVDFDASLNVAINKVRHVLRDSATSPRFIETVPRRGYRFIAPVAPVSERQESQPPTHVGTGETGIDTLAEAGAPVPVRARRTMRGAVSVLLGGSALVAATAGASFVYLSGGNRAPAPLRPIPLTTLPGLEFSPAMSPDGSHVAFLWASGDRWDPKSRVYVQPVGAAKPSMLTLEEGFPFEPAWSPDGRYLAFLRHSSPGNWSVHDIVVVPSAGGAERRLGGTSAERHGLSWSPEGRSIAIIDRPSEKEPDAVFLLSTETGQKERLTSPPPDVGDCSPTFSPDGRSLAFLRETSRSRADIYVFSFAQRTQTRLVTDEGDCNGGLDWTADGSFIVYASQSHSRMGAARLRKIAAAGGQSQDLGLEGFEPSLSRRNRHILLFTRYLIDWNAWRVAGPLGGATSSPPRRLIDSTELDFFPRYSPDGTRIAFVSQRSGTTEVWTSDSEGANPVRLTFLERDDAFKQIAWSADGREVVFTSPVNGTHDLYVVAARGGLPERITATPADERFPSFSRDGRSIYFTQRTGGTDQVWKVSRSGGPAIQMTVNGGVDARESPDGRSLYFAKGSYTEGRLGIWKMALPDGKEEKVLDHGDSARWDVYERGVCYLRVGPDQSAAIECMDVTSGLVQKLGTFDKQPLAAGFSISPDARWILLTRVDRNESDLMMVENFK